MKLCMQIPGNTQKLSSNQFLSRMLEIVWNLWLFLENKYKQLIPQGYLIRRFNYKSDTYLKKQHLD